TAGTNLTYTITVKNNGPSDNAGFTLRDVLPAGTGYVSSSAACTNAAGTVSCVQGSLVSGASVVWTITVHVNSNVADATVLSNTAAIFSNNSSAPKGTNDIATEPTTVHASADLAISKSDGMTSVTAGDGVTRTRSEERREGKRADAAGGRLSEDFPAGYTLGTVSGSGSAAFPCSLGTIVCGGTDT